jgi:DNA-binding LacI/PurR family transcriptional regulator
MNVQIPRATRFSHATATIEDVARQAGVSRQTVSNVLNAPERVRPETIESVRTAIDALGYRANRHARNLRTKTSRVIGYCLPPLSALGNSVLDTFLHALAENAEDNGYHLLLVTAPSTDREIDMYWELAAQSAIDGLVIAQTDYADIRPPALQKSRTPFVSFGRTWGDVNHSWVDVDGASGTRLAAEHLLARGHQRFAWVGHHDGSVGNDERKRGVIEALTNAGLDPASLTIVELTHDERVDHQRLQAVMDHPEPPTAFVALSDLQALTVLAEIEARGLVPGRDAAVVGFDDSPVAAYAGGGLTSIRQPIARVAQELVRLLSAQFSNPDAPAEGVLLHPELVVRRTS